MKNYEFTAIKKPIPVKFIDPLKANDEELKEIIAKFNINIKDGKWYMRTLESKAFEFTPETHLIVDGAYGDPYPINREIFEKSYDENVELVDADPSFTINDKCFSYKTPDELIAKEIEEEIEENGLYKLNCRIQDGAIKEVGINGLQGQHLVTIALAFIRKVNKDFPCRQNAITITKLEEALMWQENRTRERVKRGVEGLTKE